MSANRSRCLGLAIGSLWGIAVGGAFCIGSLWVIDTASSYWAFVAALTTTLALFVFGVSVARAATRLPRSTAPRTPADRVIARRFVWVVLAECRGVRHPESPCGVHG